LIIAASAFTVMFGTIIAVFDGYSRSLQRTVELIFIQGQTPTKSRVFYIFFLFLISIGSLVVVFQFGDDLKGLVDFATVLSFVIAPVIAIFNFRLVTGKFLDKKSQPSAYLKILSIAGIVFLIIFASLFLLSRFYSF